MNFSTTPTGWNSWVKRPHNSLSRTKSTGSRPLHTSEERMLWTNGRDSPTNTTYVQWIERGHCSYLALAIQARLRHHVEYVLDRDPSGMIIKKEKCRPLLDYALRPTRVTPSDLPYYHERDPAGVETELVAALLSHGADPSELIHIYGGQMTWELFVLFAYEQQRQQYQTAPLDNNTAFFNVGCLLLERGADLDHTDCFPSVQTHLGTTARYRTQVTVEKRRAPAREL